MQTLGTYAFSDGALLAESPHHARVGFARPADLAAARFECEDAPAELRLESGADLLSAAFGIVPFARRPLPAPLFSAAVTPAAQAAFAMFSGGGGPREGADPEDFTVLRGEPDDFIVFARRIGGVWDVGAFAVAAGTLTVRFEDVWLRTPAAFRSSLYRAEVRRDPDVRERLDGVAPDARIFLDHSASGGFLITFTPMGQ